MEEASGLNIENGLRHLQACLSSTGVIYVSGCFLRAYPETMVLMDGPCGRFEELTHVLWLFSLAKYVLVSILAIQLVWRRLHLDILSFVVLVFFEKSSRISRQKQFDPFTPMFVHRTTMIIAMNLMDLDGLTVVLAQWLRCLCCLS